MKQAIIFSRVSSQQQDLVQQTNELINEAKKSGYEDLIFIERKESAIKLDEEERQGLQALKEEIERNKNIDCVFVYEISRISRRPKVIYSIRDFLVERKIQLVCLKPFMRLLDNDGTMSQSASIIFSIFASLSESEMMLKKERLRRGVNYKKALGYHAGGPVTYGYKVVKTDSGYKYEIDEVKGKIVQRIFHEYVNGGKSMRLLTRDLQEEGYFKGIKFLTAVQEVYDILHKDCYCGRKKGMPALISEEMYDKSVEKRKSSILKVNHTSNMSMLKGLLRDGTTGLLLSSNTAAGMYYSKRHSGIAVGMHIIEPVIWDVAVQLHKRYNKMDKEQVLNALTRKLQLNERKIYTLTQELYEISSKHDAIEERIIKGRLSETKANQMHEELDSQEKEIRLRLKELYDIKDKIQEEGENVMRTGNIDIDYNTTDKKEIYEIVHAVIEKIILRRESRYILICTIYNKIDDDIKEIKIDTYKKKILK